MSKISSTTVIIVGLIAIMITTAFRQKRGISRHRGLLTKICFVIAAIIFILAIVRILL